MFPGLSHPSSSVPLTFVRDSLQLITPYALQMYTYLVEEVVEMLVGKREECTLN